MTDTMLDDLARERAAFLAAFEGVPAAHRATRPESGGWSALEVVEHVARLDRSICRLVAHYSAKPLSATEEQLAAAQLDDDRRAALHDRSRRMEAPEPVQPSGALDEGAVLEELTGAREAVVACYGTADARVLDGATYRHPYFGALTLRAWFRLLGHHDARHSEQLGELAAHWRARAGESRP